MQYSAIISGVGGYLPPDILTNKDLEKLVETNDEWIRTRTGIEERRILKIPGWATSDMGVEAIKNLVDKTGLDVTEIDMIICATVTADRVFPDTANTIADKVGATRAFGYDINAACSGFLYALVTAAQFIRTGMYEKIVVVGADMMSSIIDYDDRSTCIIFGDAAGAVLLERGEEGYGFQHAVLRGDGSGRHFLYMEAGGSHKPSSLETVANKEHAVRQEGRTVFKSAVKEMSNAVADLVEEQGLTVEDVDWLVPHQANLRILQTVSSMTNIPMDKVMINIQKYGNTTAATLPLCLWDYENQIKKGQRIVFTAFGGGFTWGACDFIWAY
jgi:3-oxoacyl-[acyl-carrier-protein] synthase-3